MLRAKSHARMVTLPMNLLVSVSRATRPARRVWVPGATSASGASQVSNESTMMQMVCVNAHLASLNHPRNLRLVPSARVSATNAGTLGISTRICHRVFVLHVPHPTRYSKVGAIVQ
eukprot:Lithocolla_globosa_v1_NODE_168_length_5520_cov_7.529003.p4 type:complete len:116 gc:universal NODE_168_length_5520_cov_7.529003:3947-3600(-)